jgi:hypothetical protein
LVDVMRAVGAQLAARRKQNAGSIGMSKVKVEQSVTVRLSECDDAVLAVKVQLVDDYPPNVGPICFATRPVEARA